MTKEDRMQVALGLKYQCKKCKKTYTVFDKIDEDYDDYDSVTSSFHGFDKNFPNCPICNVCCRTLPSKDTEHACDECNMKYGCRGVKK